MEAINALLEGFDLSKLVPDLTSFLGWLQMLCTIAVLLGPILLLVFGLIYLTIPPKEANHRFGFRTYFGMGSVEAWLFTQKLAGIVWTALGGVLLIVAGIICMSLSSKTVPEVAMTAVKCLLAEAGASLLGWLVITLTTVIAFDRHGNRRK